MGDKINAKLISKLIERHFKRKYSCLIIKEIRVDNSFLDMIIVPYDKKTNEIGKIIGIEIKSDKDSFRRMEIQLNNYYKLCDKVYLALESKNKPEKLPWGVGIIRISKKEIKFEKPADPIYNSISLTKKSLLLFNKTYGMDLSYKNFLEFSENIEQIRKKILLTKIISSKNLKQPIKLKKSELDLIKIFSILLNSK